MLRPLATLAAVALAGLIVLKIAFGITAGILGFLLGLAIKVALACGAIYLALRVLSPDTARKMREHFVGPGQP